MGDGGYGTCRTSGRNIIFGKEAVGNEGQRGYGASGTTRGSISATFGKEMRDTGWHVFSFV